MTSLPFTGPATAPVVSTPPTTSPTVAPAPTSTPVVGGAPALPPEVAAALAMVEAYQAKATDAAPVDRSKPLPARHSLVRIDIANPYADPPTVDEHIALVLDTDAEGYTVSMLILGQTRNATVLSNDFVKPV